MLPELTYNSLTKFTVVRNPWDRMVSSYFSPHEGRENYDKREFKQVIMESQPMQYYLNSFPNWYRFLPLNPLKNSEIDYFIRFENLESDFHELSKFFGIEGLKLDKLNKSKRTNYQYYYDSSLKEMVYKKFKKEIEFFEYLF